MFYILETKEQLRKLLKHRRGGAYAELIPGNYFFHPNLNSTLAVYIRPLEMDEGYILPISHPDGLGLERDLVKKVLFEFDHVYVWDKKEWLYHFVLPNLMDLQLITALEKYERIELPGLPKTVTSYYGKYSGRPDINKMIPLTKLYERCENNFESIKGLLSYI